MIIDEGDSNGNLIRYTTNVYYDDEYTYEQTYISTNHAFTSSGNGIWYKFKSPEGASSSKNQLSPIINLLKSANEVISLNNEKVNSEDCQVISIVPSAEAVADWLIAQSSSPGPGLSVSTVPSIIGKNMFV